MATIRGRLLFEVQTLRLLFISALPQCSDYSRAATILSIDVAATIYFSSTTQARRKQLSVGSAGRDKRAKHPLGCLGHDLMKTFSISDLLRSFLVQSLGEIA